MQQQKKNAVEKPDLDPQSLAAIRNLMAEEPPIKPEPVEQREKAKAKAQEPKPAPARGAAPPRSKTLPALAAQDPSQVQVADSGEKPVEKKRRKAKAAKAPKAPKIPKAPREPGLISRQISKLTAKADPLKARVVGYRPTRKHILWAVFALIVIMRPWLVIGLFFLGLMIIGIAFLILGYDGFWLRGMALGRWYARRRPARAVVIHQKLDDFAMRWDAVLDRFPEGSVDGLYLPDFGALAEADARHDAAMERRLAGMRESEV